METSSEWDWERIRMRKPSMPVPQVGQTVENLELFTPAGEVIRLEDLLDREYLLLIFLRHLT
jgi:hypothetical protein